MPAFSVLKQLFSFIYNFKGQKFVKRWVPVFISLILEESAGATAASGFSSMMAASFTCLDLQAHWPLSTSLSLYLYLYLYLHLYLCLTSLHMVSHLLENLHLACASHIMVVSVLHFFNTAHFYKDAHSTKCSKKTW